MNHIDLPSPKPRETEHAYSPIKYPIIRRRYLPKPDAVPKTEFDAVLLNRRTRRCFGGLREEDLSGVLWHSAKVREARIEPSGFMWSHRSAPSSGGRHPIDLLLMDLSDTKKHPELYDPLAHCLCELQLDDVEVLRDFAAQVGAIMGTNNGTCICFVADFDRMGTKYLHCESLVWRDAGCLLATMHLVAEWHGLNFSAVGPTGEPYVSKALHGGSRTRGVGACVFGRRPVAQ